MEEHIRDRVGGEEQQQLPDECDARVRREVHVTQVRRDEHRHVLLPHQREVRQRGRRRQAQHLVERLGVEHAPRRAPAPLRRSDVRRGEAELQAEHDRRGDRRADPSPVERVDQQRVEYDERRQREYPALLHRLVDALGGEVELHEAQEVLGPQRQ